MAYLIGLPLLVLAAVAQSTVLPHVRVLGGAADLVLLLALSWTLAGDWRGGMVWAFVGGLCLDLLSGGPLGVATIGLVLMAYFASLTEGRFWRSHFLLPLATAITCTVGFHCVYLAVISASGQAVNWGTGFGAIILPATLLNTLCMLPIYHALRWLHGLVFPTLVTM
jgi:rod shape-determining protein MreD